MKAYKGSPFAIVKDEWWMEGAACEHGLCERLHSKNGCPEVRRFEYKIIEIATGNRMGMGDAFQLRRDAVAHLEAHLIWMEKMGLNS